MNDHCDGEEEEGWAGHDLVASVNQVRDDRTNHGVVLEIGSVYKFR